MITLRIFLAATQARLVKDLFQGLTHYVLQVSIMDERPRTATSPLFCNLSSPPDQDQDALWVSVLTNILPYIPKEKLIVT